MSWAAEHLEDVDACPVCDGRSAARLHPPLGDPLDPGSAAQWRFHRCDACGSAFLGRRPTVDAIHMAYRSYTTHGPPPPVDPPASGVARMRRALLNGYLRHRFGYSPSPSWGIGRVVVAMTPWGPGRAGRVVRGIPGTRPGRLLDVGCANGAYLLQMSALGWDAEGVETDPQAAAYARAAGARVREGVLSPEVAGGAFDALTLGHVIEHVHDPRALLAECRRVLRPGGTLWIATPNLESAGYRAFGPHYVQLDPPRHLVLFTPASMRTLLQDAGFTDVSPQPAVPQARAWTFRHSQAIRLGLGSHPEPLPALPRTLAARAAAADARALVSPSRAEEIVLVARAPADRASL